MIGRFKLYSFVPQRSAFIAFLLLFVLSSASAQYIFNKQWDKRFGGEQDDGLDSFLLIDSNRYMLGGSSNSGISGDKTQANRDSTLSTYDAWIVAIDSAGTKLWDKRYGGNRHDIGPFIIQAKSGGYLLAGQSASGISGDKTEPSRGGFDYWVVKIDEAGNKLWDRRFGGTSADYLYAAIATHDGGYLLGGLSNSGIGGDKTEANRDPSYFNDDGWIVKIDSLGTKQWDKTYGGVKEDDITALLQLDDGGYLLGGYVASDSGGDVSQQGWGWGDYWLIKTDSLGNKEWDKRYGGTGRDSFLTFAKTNDGGYILGGHSTSDSSGNKSENRWNHSYDLWVVKIDSVGNILWDKDYGGFGDDRFRGIYQTADGGYLISSYTNSQTSGDKTEDNLNLEDVLIWVIKTDSSGNIQWDKTILTTGFAGGYAQPLKDNCYLVGAITVAGVGGYKTQANWDSTNQTRDYWMLKFCMDPFTGIHESAGQLQVSVYPNPFTSDVAVSLYQENLHQATFSLTNLLGQSIYLKEEKHLADSYTKMLDLSYLPAGIYLLAITINGQRTVRQIVKQ